jgi:hypothetical protein
MAERATWLQSGGRASGGRLLPIGEGRCGVSCCTAESIYCASRSLVVLNTRELAKEKAPLGKGGAKVVKEIHQVRVLHARTSVLSQG